MFKFQFSVHKTWRSFWVFAGVFWVGAYYASWVRNEKLFENPILFLIIMFLIPFMAPIGRYILYQSVSENNFIFNYLFFKKQILIKNITSLLYENRPAWRYLVIKYTDRNGKEKSKEFSVDFHDPIDMLQLNEELKKINPNIEIIFDEKSQKFMEEKKDVHKKAPKSILGWVWFAIRWGGITALLNLGFLEIVRYFDPSVFK